MKKIVIISLLPLLMTSCFLLRGLIYNSYNRNLNMPVAHFNVYDKNDSLINTSIYQDKVVIITFCRLGKFRPDYFAYFNKIINHFSNFSEIKFVNIAVELNREEWLRILSKNPLKGDNYLCKDSQNKIYDFYNEGEFNFSVIYNKSERIMGYGILQDGLMIGPFYVLKNHSVVEGLRIFRKKSKMDTYTKYVADELGKAAKDSTYVFNPEFNEVK